MGLPVVATRADGSVEAIDHGKTGYLAETGEVEALARIAVSS